MEAGAVVTPAVQARREALYNTIARARRELNMLETENGLRLTAEEAARRVLEQVADHHSVTVDDLTGPSRLANHVKARHEAAYLLRQCSLSYPQIGRILGGRDHTTIMYAVQRVEQKRGK
jgi:chromosomal replication initiator protein